MNGNSVNASIPEQSIAVIATYVGVMEEEVLISAARSGDSGAFVELYLRHNRRVLPRIYRITRNREDAEDALQDAALKAFVHLRSFEGRSSFASWFTRIAINSALMVLRRKRPGSKVSIEQLCEQSENHGAWEPQDHTDSPEDYYARRESEELLRKAIQRLPFIFREAMVFQQSEECSIEQVATELGISESAAKSRLMRGRKVLERRLSGTRPKTVSPPASGRRASSSRTNSKAVSASATGRLEASQSEGGREQ
jgi:RNA polymerase sigma-70 factor (ECF subfamily)